VPNIWRRDHSQCFSSSYVHPSGALPLPLPWCQCCLWWKSFILE